MNSECKEVGFCVAIVTRERGIRVSRMMCDRSIPRLFHRYSAFDTSLTACFQLGTAMKSSLYKSSFPSSRFQLSTISTVVLFTEFNYFFADEGN